MDLHQGTEHDGQPWAYDKHSGPLQLQPASCESHEAEAAGGQTVRI